MSYERQNGAETQERCVNQINPRQISRLRQREECSSKLFAHFCAVFKDNFSCRISAGMYLNPQQSFFFFSPSHISPQCSTLIHTRVQDIKLKLEAHQKKWGNIEHNITSKGVMWTGTYFEMLKPHFTRTMHFSLSAKINHRLSLTWHQRYAQNLSIMSIGWVFIVRELYLFSFVWREVLLACRPIHMFSTLYVFLHVVLHQNAWKGMIDAFRPCSFTLSLPQADLIDFLKCGWESQSFLRKK